MFRSVICLISVRRPEETGLIVERGDYVEVFDHRYLSNHVYTPFIMLIRSCSGNSSHCAPISSLGIYILRVHIGRESEAFVGPAMCGSAL